MKRVVKEDARREERITMEIVVDCNNEDEVAVGWYCYLENTLKFHLKRGYRFKSAARIGPCAHHADIRRPTRSRSPMNGP